MQGPSKQQPWSGPISGCHFRPKCRKTKGSTTVTGCTRQFVPCVCVVPTSPNLTIFVCNREKSRNTWTIISRAEAGSSGRRTTPERSISPVRCDGESTDRSATSNLIYEYPGVSIVYSVDMGPLCGKGCIRPVCAWERSQDFVET